MDRQVVRIVTPGSLVEDTMLTPDENNYLAALCLDDAGSGDTWGLAWADLSTGEFVSTTATPDKLANALLRCAPKEVLLPAAADPTSPDPFSDAVKELLEAAIPHTCMRTYRPSASDVASSLKTNALPSRAAADWDALASLHRAEQAAALAVLDYVAFTQKSATSLVRAPLHVESSDHMIIDASAWKALELAKVRTCGYYCTGGAPTPVYVSHAFARSLSDDDE